MSPDVDVLIAGGGPIGLASAIEARLLGLSVAVFEPRTGPIDKACGEGLMPGAVAALARLGVFPRGHVIEGISYHQRAHHAEHRFRRGAGLGVRRTELHDALTERCTELGVEWVRQRLDSYEQTSDDVVAGGVRASWLLGCDGLHSKTRRLAGLERQQTRPAGGSRRYGYRRHFELEPWSDLVEVHWGDEVEAYVTPVADTLVGVAILGPGGVDFDTAIAGIPALANRLSGARPGSPLRAAGPLRQGSRRRTVGRVLLVGDAAGYVDALTGEGIRVGLAQAEAVVAAIHAGTPRAYERTWERATRDFRTLTTGLVALAHSPLRNSIVPISGAVPRVFGAVVERLAR
ncbi:NAD(P)/FAD-dependent oxidoreductase [Homoserinimonas sp. OAct 916]|uniref:NAD(P)/FAD-dependent oxidoreductase n=1 Tax=Homoserinimonas sp. OAct 916 TaxID=2211450 RepID=UPI000DBE77F2|nr:NAD(P)/FAD-dependent oxidoreductase [Homoserinimonas sp. OAct 916]